MIQGTNKVTHWGILGPGRIAHQFAQAIKTIKNCHLSVVHSSEYAKSSAFSEQYAINFHTNDLTEFYNTSHLDVVYIAYPHGFHFDAIMMALEHGKHVLCEKPLTISAKQAKQVFAVARDKQCFVMEALWTRFLPIWEQVRQWLTTKQIGKILNLESSFGFEVPFNANDRLFNPALGGGALWDLGIYPISMSQFIMRALPLSLEKNITRGITNVDEHSTVSMIYPNNISSNFTVSFRECLANQFVIHGSAGKIIIPEPFWGAEKAILDSEVKNEVIEKPHLVNGFEYQIAHVHHMITANQTQSPVVSWQDTVDCQHIIDALLDQTS